MAKNNRRRRSATYARPVVTGNQTMSFDLSQAKFSSSLTDGVILTPNKIRALLGLNTETVDAIKITSIVVSPWIEFANTTSGSSTTVRSNNQWVVDFVDGQRYVASDKAKPTKVTPSALSPAGRWQEASSTSVQLVKITGPHIDVSGGNSHFMGSCIVYVAVRCDQPTQTALAPA